MRFKATTASGSSFFAAPEIGLVPLALSPYVSLNVGVSFGG